MAVMRVERTDGFTVMSNYHLRDQALSLKAIGLLSKILALPPDWDYTVEGLAAICKESRAAIDSAIHELEDAGYIVRRRVRDERGRLAGCEYTVYEQPVKDLESPICDFPKLDNPNVDNPILENHEQININLNKYLNNNTPLPPQAGDGVSEETPKAKKAKAKKTPKPRTTKYEPDYEPEMFKRFWAAYPRGEDPQLAIAEWDKLKPSRELMYTMGKALERQKNSDDWRRKVGIPYACRWLKYRRWEDEARDAPPEATGGWAEPREVL